MSVRAILGPGCVCRARRKRRRSGWNGRHALASAQRWTDRSSVPPCLPGVPPRPVGRRACLGVSPWKPSHPPLPNSGCGDIGHPTIPAEHRPPAEFLRGNLAIGGNAQVTSEAMGIRRPLCLSHKVAWEGLRSLPPLLRRGIGRYALIRGRFGRASLSSAPKGSLGGPWLQPACQPSVVGARRSRHRGEASANLTSHPTGCFWPPRLRGWSAPDSSQERAGE